jgi:hypothetical protein
MPCIPSVGASRSSRASLATIALAGMSFAAAACGDNHVASPHARGMIGVSSGNAQRGLPGHPLGRPIVLVVRNSTGDPASDVHVNWFADDGGSFEPAQSVTDENGLAAATWTLGGAAIHHGRAIADGYVDAEFTASTDINAELPLDVLVPLELKTYDGSGQTVHPDFVATGGAWPGSNQYLFITPYPNGNANFENPSIFESTQPAQWAAPVGMSNPIFTPREGYYSDPDAVYVAERNEVWLYFRQVTSENIIRLTTSGDGVNWSTPVTVVHAPNHELISPTVVRRAAHDWLMWAVNGNVGCTGASTKVELRRSTDGITWSNVVPVALSQPGFAPWHIDVEWIASRGEFWALYNVKTSGSCTTSAVYLATSGDGVHWTTFPSPVLARGAIAELRDVVYRSTFSYDESSDAITFWYSGARLEGTVNVSYSWHSVVQRRLRADVFAAINAPTAAAPLAAARVQLPPLTNFP